MAGWLKRGPTGVIGTNKSDAAETVRSLLADLAGGPGPDDVQLPRAGLLPHAGRPGEPGEGRRWRALLAERGVRPVSYADWLRIETAEKELGGALGRGARVKLASRDEIHRACGLADSSPARSARPVRLASGGRAGRALQPAGQLADAGDQLGRLEDRELGAHRGQVEGDHVAASPSPRSARSGPRRRAPAMPDGRRTLLGDLGRAARAPAPGPGTGTARW